MLVCVEMVDKCEHCAPRASSVAGVRSLPPISAADSSSAAAISPLALSEAVLPFCLYALQPLAAVWKAQV